MEILITIMRSVIIQQQHAKPCDKFVTVQKTGAFRVVQGQIMACWS